MGDYYSNIGIGEEPTTGYSKYQAVEKMRDEAEPGAFLDAAFQEAMSPFAIKRIFDRRSSQFQEDRDWVISDQDREELNRDYDLNETKYLEESKSQDEFNARRRYIQEDKDRQQAIALSGCKGAVANVVFSLFDPVWMVTGAVTGGMGYGAKATGLAKAARVAALSGIEAAAIESILVKGNTQLDSHNILHALAGGAALGGIIGGVGALRSSASKILEMSSVEHALATDAENAIASDLIKEIPKSKSILDMRSINRRINTKSIELKRAFDSGAAWTNKRFGEVRTKLKGLESELAGEEQAFRNAQSSVEHYRNKLREEQRSFIAKAEPERQKIRDEYSVKINEQQDKIKAIEKNLEIKDTPKTQAKLWKEEMKLQDLVAEQTKKITEIETKLKGKVHAAEFKFRRSLNAQTLSANERRELLKDQISKHRADLDLAVRSRRAEKEMNDWESLTQDQKIKQLFGDKAPVTSELVQDRIRASEPINPEGNLQVSEMMDVEQLPDSLEANTVHAITDSPVGSAGAAQAGFRPLKRIYEISPESQQRIAKFGFDGGNVPDDLRGRRILPKFTKAVQSIQTRLSNSNDQVIRGLAYHLFEAGQGGTSNPNGTAALMADIYGKQFRSAMRGRLKDGMEIWRKNQGISLMQSIMKTEIAHGFYKKVMTEVRFPGSHADEGIKTAADGVRDLFEMAGKVRSAAGEAGFENLKLNRNYVTTIVDESLIKSAVLLHGREKVEEVLSMAYQRGGYQLPEHTANYIAKGYVNRSLDHTLGMIEFKSAIKGSDLEGIRKALTSSGVEAEIVEQILTETAEQNLKQGLSNRAKKSFEPDIRVEINGLKMVDLIEADLPKLLESYTREAAGGAAMGRLGFKTRRQAMEFLVDVKKSAYNNASLSRAEIDSEVQLIQDGINMIYGRSINEDASSTFIRNLSRLRDATGLLRLQTMGVATIPELARVTAQRGIKNVMEACPSLGAFFGTKGLREGGTYAGKWKKADLAELEQMLYYVGEDHVLYPGYLRIDNIEESALYNSVGGMIDNAMAQGKRVQEVVSAFRAIQGSGEKLAVRSLAIQIKKWADGVGSGLSRANINDAGWHGGFMDELKAWMTSNPRSEIYNGQDVRMFNFGKMPPEMQERLVMGMHRLVMRDMQRPLVGELPVFMNKWMGQIITQFRNFSILSLGKQLMHDVRHDPMAGSLIAMHSLAMSVAAYGIYVAHKGIGRKDQDEYFAKAFSPGEMTFGVLNRMGQLASVGVAGDMLATLGLLPDDLMAAPGQSGYRGLTSTSIPIVGVAEDAKNALTNIPDLLKGDVEPGKALRDLQKIIPFGKAIGINQAFNAMSGALDN